MISHKNLFFIIKFDWCAETFDVLQASMDLSLLFDEQDSQREAEKRRRQRSANSYDTYGDGTDSDIMLTSSEFTGLSHFSHLNATMLKVTIDMKSRV
jgi:hypothetical protein